MTQEFGPIFTLSTDDFTEIVRVEVFKDNLFYACQQQRDGSWRCGKCWRGVLIPKMEKCRVCHSDIHWAEAVNWERFQMAKEAMMRREARKA